MRRLAILTVLLAGLGSLVVALAGPSAQGSSSYTFAVTFDDARGLIAGQLIKIAGAKAGTISDVKVTPEFKALIEGSVDQKFAFHKDATCTIRPEGLIAENYVDCNPGTPGSAPLPNGPTGVPTVPVTQTTEPVSLLNLFNMFNLPTRQRFMVIIDELGIGTAGEGQNFNDILRRANPTLGLANQVIGILSRQRDQLASLVDSTNTIAAEAATHTNALQSFLSRAATLTSTTSAHSGNLSTAINRLPGLLATAQPSLAALDAFAKDSTPLVQQLRAAAPTLDTVAADLKPFVAAAKPGLARLSAALDRAIPAIYDTTPVIRTLNTYLRGALPSTKLMGRLLTNLQATGFSENLLSVFYYVTATLARYDNVSHLSGIYLVAPQSGACGNYATTPVPGCSAHYGSMPAYTPQPTVAAHRDRHQPASTGAAARPPAAGAAPVQAAKPSKPNTPLQSLVQQETTLAKNLITKLVQGGGQSTGQALQALQGALQGSNPKSSATLQNLVNYLLR